MEIASLNIGRNASEICLGTHQTEVGVEGADGNRPNRQNQPCGFGCQ